MTGRDVAHERLIDALNPSTQDEQRMITWLSSMLTPAELDVWSAMVERVESTAYAAGRKATGLDRFDEGFDAGARAARERSRSQS